MKLKFEKIENYVDGRFECPQIKVTNPATGLVGYLAPFRWYSFQISGTPDGESDLGSSVPKLFKNYYGNLEEQFTVQVMHCINAFLDNAYGWTGEPCAYTLGGNVESYKMYKELYYGKTPDYTSYTKYPIEEEDWVTDFVRETIRCFRKYYGVAQS